MNVKIQSNIFSSLQNSYSNISSPLQNCTKTLQKIGVFVGSILIVLGPILHIYANIGIPGTSITVIVGVALITLSAILYYKSRVKEERREEEPELFDDEKKTFSLSMAEYKASNFAWKTSFTGKDYRGTSRGVYVSKNHWNSISVNQYLTINDVKSRDNTLFGMFGLLVYYEDIPPSRFSNFDKEEFMDIGNKRTYLFASESERNDFISTHIKTYFDSKKINEKIVTHDAIFDVYWVQKITVDGQQLFHLSYLEENRIFRTEKEWKNYVKEKDRYFQEGGYYLLDSGSQKGDWAIIEDFTQEGEQMFEKQADGKTIQTRMSVMLSRAELIRQFQVKNASKSTS